MAELGAGREGRLPQEAADQLGATPVKLSFASCLQALNRGNALSAAWLLYPKQHILFAFACGTIRHSVSRPFHVHTVTLLDQIKSAFNPAVIGVWQSIDVWQVSCAHYRWLLPRHLTAGVTHHSASLLVAHRAALGGLRRRPGAAGAAGPQAGAPQRGAQLLGRPPHLRPPARDAVRPAGAARLSAATGLSPGFSPISAHSLMTLQACSPAHVCLLIFLTPSNRTPLLVCSRAFAQSVAVQLCPYTASPDGFQ